jgi:leader peptidase (prepilin peptidase)/N-methyltransferase
MEATALLQISALGPADWALIAVSPAIGSFMGLLISRLPRHEPVLWDRSRCERCGTVLGAGDLVPLASWLVRRGRCRHCGEALGWFYPGVELLALAVAAVSMTVDRGVGAWLDALLGWFLVTLGWIDMRDWLLPDILTLPLIVAGLAAAALFAPQDLFDRAAGAAAGFASLWLISAIYLRLRGYEGLGRGDAKLLAAGGAWVGLWCLPSVVAGAAVGALIVAAGSMLAGVRLGRRSALPFGPFLALAIWLVWLFGPVG